MGRQARLTLALVILTGAAAAANPARNAAFQFLGPAPITKTAHDMDAAGAIQAVAIDPTNKNVVWIGAANGGVWKTSDFHPNEPSHAPTWTPLTDTLPSLSIAAISIDPTDATAQTVVAALGDLSSAASYHGPEVGILRTTDGGAHWKALGAIDLAGQSLTGVAARGATIVVTSMNKSGGGVFRSTDTGASFTRLSGTSPLPDGAATALVGDPAHDGRLWVGIVGTGGGVFESETTSSAHIGETWTRVSSTALDTDAEVARKLALDARAHDHDEHQVYVAVLDSAPDPGTTGDNIKELFRLTQTGNGSTSSDRMAAPTGLQTADQGKIAILGDPIHDDAFFVAGDEGLVFRCVQAIGATGAPSCTGISDRNGSSGNTAHGTAPHPDARMLVMDTETALIGTDDGGIYVRTSPRKPTGDWFAKLGNLAITEVYSCAYDAHAKVTVCGAQDNGVVGQPTPGATVWDQLENTDGGVIAISDDLFTCPFDHAKKCTSRYFSTHSLDSFTHDDCDEGNTCKPDPGATGTTLVYKGHEIVCAKGSTAAGCDGALSERTPLAADRFDAQRIAIEGDRLYESKDGGATLTEVHGWTGSPSPALLMGGKRNGTDDAELLLAASSDGLFARTAAGTSVTKTSWNVSTQGVPTAIAVDHGDWSSVWVTTTVDPTTRKARVFHGTDVAGPHEAWTDVTGDLAPADASAADLHAIAHVGGKDAYVVVGADDGLYAARTDELAHWWKLAGALPDVPVGSLAYSKSDDVLVIGTVGRSAWSIGNATQVFAPLILHVVHDPPHVVVPDAGPGHVNPGDPVETTPAAERRRKKKPR